MSVIVVLGGKTLVTKIQGKKTRLVFLYGYHNEMLFSFIIEYSTIDNEKRGNGQGQETNVEGRNVNIQDEKRYDSIPGEETKTGHNDMLKRERDDHIVSRV